ncbi:TlpA family protein disulfide reductase [Pontibacter diazotrophicus]|uniref:TlpA family protein disulfide reductase n=1 Tax=Pontibacter diazotrophicus TaxID=1400979 RepID=UPI0015F16F33|nr:TlpA disulfide reductase family protein [Pontibacter diazotrophicus]
MKQLLFVVSLALSFSAHCQDSLVGISDAPLVTLEGDTLTRDHLTGKVLVLNFWFIACGPCRQEIPALDKLRTKYIDNKDVTFIAISSMDEFDKIRYFVSRRPFGYEHATKNREWLNFYKVVVFPTNIVIDKTGKMTFRQKGYMPDIFTELDREIQKSL